MSKKLISESSSVKSSYDFELSIKRENDVVYNYSYPKDRKIKGIVFIIPGFGEDTNSDYLQKLRDYIAYKFDLICVNVMYHCFYSRLNNGGIEFLDEFDKSMLLDNLKSIDTKLTTNNLNEVFFSINDKAQMLKESGELDKKLLVNQTMTILPKNNEYQNFGILQALDHINVLKELRNKNLDFINNYPTILMGSSHGGYIANLIAKIAPNSIDCIIDNSSYIKPPLNYIIGKENNMFHGEFKKLYGENLIVNYFVKTMWEKDENSFYHFSKDRHGIRDMSNKSHNEITAKRSKSKTRYISYHSTEDEIAPYEDKKEFYEQLEELGYDATLKTISDISQVDGSFIKTLKHGLEMSIKQLANIELSEALKIRSQTSTSEIEPIVYPCDSVEYNFEDINGVFSASLSPIENIEEKIIEIFNKNMEYFEKKQAHLYSKLASYDSAVEQGLYKSRYELVFNNNYLDVKELETGKYLYLDNSDKYAYEIAKQFKNKSDMFVFFGVGLGVHLDKIIKNTQAKSSLIIENDLEMFKLSTFVTPYFELAKSSDLYFSIFEEDDVFLKIAKEFFSDFKESQKILNHFEMNNDYKNKILLLSRLIGKLDV